MAATMDQVVTALSKETGDWFEGTADTNATNPTYTIVDTALVEKQDDWVTDGASGEQPSYVYIKTDAGGSSAAPEGEERKISSLDASTYTMLVSSDYPFSAGVANGDTYEIHRTFSRNEKEQAIVHACNEAFPHVYKEIQNRSIVIGDWLANGDFEKWTSSSAPDNWVVSGLTASKDGTNAYTFGLGSSYACLFSASGAAGYIKQDIGQIQDLRYLAEKTVKFYVWGYTSGADELCLGITDGTTTVYGNHTSHASSTKVYHPGDSTYRLMWVELTIDENPTEVTFTIFYNTSDANAYVDKACVIAGDTYVYNISYYDFYNDRPLRVYRLIGADADDDTPAINPQKVLLDSSQYHADPSGKLYIDCNLSDGTRLELVGIGLLTTPVSTYGGGTAVSTEIDNMNKEGKIVVAEAAKYLCQRRMHNSITQDIQRWQQLYAYWDNECRNRKSKYAMKSIPLIR